MADARTATLWALAAVEARRFARHPLTLAGAVVSVSWLLRLSWEDPIDPGLAIAPIVPLFAFGLFGMITAARLTRTVDRSLAHLAGTPASERTRTAAMALACLVPAAAAASFAAYLLVFFWFRRPSPDAWWYGRLATVDVICVVLSFGVVPAYGGPILGVLTARYLRWSGAPYVLAVVLTAITVAGQGIWVQTRTYREIMPVTSFYGGDDGHGADIWYPGSPPWYLVYGCCLCIVGVLVALVHDRSRRRRPLVLLAVAVLAIGLAASVTSMTTGEQRTRHSPSTLHLEQRTRPGP